MKRFKEYLNEDFDLAIYNSDGGISIDDPTVVSAINANLERTTARPFITPYNALEEIRKILSYYKIFLPKSVFLDQNHGHDVFQISQFGEKIGITNQGEVVTAHDSSLFVYFEWSMTEHGLYDIFSSVVNDEELDEIMSDYESEVADDLQEESMPDLKKKMGAKKVTLPNMMRKEETLDEVSQKAATDAYAAADDPDYYHPKADDILKHIRRKFGKEAEKGAENHAYADHFGRGTPRPGKDSLSGGLRQYASDKVTKSGKIPKGTQTAMKNKMDPKKWQGYGRKVGGPKGLLPEETKDSLSGGLKRTDLGLSDKLNKKGKLSRKTQKWMKTLAHGSGTLYSRSLGKPKGHLPEETINEIADKILKKITSKRNGKPNEVKNYRGVIDNDMWGTKVNVSAKSFAAADKKVKAKAKNDFDGGPKHWSHSTTEVPKYFDIRDKYKTKEIREESINEVSHKLAKKAERKSFKQYYNAYDDEASARKTYIKDKTPEAKANSDAAREKRLKIMKRTASLQKFVDKKKNLEEVLSDPKKRAEYIKNAKADRDLAISDREHYKKNLTDPDKTWTKGIPHKDSQYKMAVDRNKRAMKRKEGIERAEKKNTVKEDKAPFDNPTKKPSTPYKNPDSKAKQLSRQAMKRLRDALVTDAKMSTVATKRAMKKAKTDKK